jgi:hypothetical protein
MPEACPWMHATHCPARLAVTPLNISFEVADWILQARRIVYGFCAPSRQPCKIEARAAALTDNRWNAFWRKISLYGVKIEADCAA